MGQLGKAYGGEGSKITFRFLYWGLINRRENTEGGAMWEVTMIFKKKYGHVSWGSKSCGLFVSLGLLGDVNANCIYFCGLQSTKFIKFISKYT